MTDVDDRDEMAQVTWRARTASTVGVHIVSEIRSIVVSTPKISQIFAFFKIILSKLANSLSFAEEGLAVNYTMSNGRYGDRYHF